MYSKKEVKSWRFHSHLRSNILNLFTRFQAFVLFYPSELLINHDKLPPQNKTNYNTSKCRVWTTAAWHLLQIWTNQLKLVSRLKVLFTHSEGPVKVCVLKDTPAPSHPPQQKTHTHLKLPYELCEKTHQSTNCKISLHIWFMETGATKTHSNCTTSALQWMRLHRVHPLSPVGGAFNGSHFVVATSPMIDQHQVLIGMGWS